MAVQAQAGAITIILVVILAAVAVSILPLSPSITVSFQITTQPLAYTSPYYQAVITLGGVQYQKVSLTTYYGSQRDTLILSQITGQTGTYRLGASISYGGTFLSQGNYTLLGDGFYQLKIEYFPRTENANTPYIIDMILYLQTTSPFSLTVTVMPS